MRQLREHHRTLGTLPQLRLRVPLPRVQAGVLQGQSGALGDLPEQGEGLVIEGFSAGTAAHGDDAGGLAPDSQRHARDGDGPQPLELVRPVGSDRFEELLGAHRVPDRSS